MSSISVLLIQIRLFCFLTDSVFYVLFAYFDESMASIRGYVMTQKYRGSIVALFDK